jgi:drug/metabolite transporter (DMT)-like permease
VALLAKFWLHDTISPTRWAGIVLITIGVGFVAQGPSLTERPAKPSPVIESAAAQQEEHVL